MAGRAPWQDGRRAWERNYTWYGCDPALTHPALADSALAALQDFQLIRQLLDVAELKVVLTARRHGKSWVEIATRLGMSSDQARAKWAETEEASRQAGP